MIEGFNRHRCHRRDRSRGERRRCRKDRKRRRRSRSRSISRRHLYGGIQSNVGGYIQQSSASNVSKEDIKMQYAIHAAIASTRDDGGGKMSAVSKGHPSTQGIDSRRRLIPAGK